MQWKSTLPTSLCKICTTHALAAYSFITLCKESAEQWEQIVTFLKNIPLIPDKKGYYIIIEKHISRLVTDKKYAGDNIVDATKRIKQRLSQQASSLKRSIRQRQLKSLDPITDGVPLKKKKLNLDCPDCNITFESMQKLNRHLRESRKLACRYCYSIVNFNDLKNHYLRHNVKACACEICSEVFVSKYELKAHIEVHTSKPYSCIKCKRTFSTARALGHHRAKHVQKVCLGCHKTFNNKICYNNHEKQCMEKDFSEKSNPCPDCKTNYNSIYALNRHLQGSGVRACQFCKDIVAINDIRKHLKMHNVNTFDCDLCPDSFESVNYYKIHIKKHSKGKFSCVNCQYTFRTNTGLVRHLRTHKPIELDCPYCNRSFINRRCFQKHTKKCSKELNSASGSSIYTCPNCNFGFISLYYLNQHLQEALLRMCSSCHKIVNIENLRDHLREHDMITYNCSVCPDSYVSEIKLQKHLKLHEPRSFMCFECKQTFNTNYALII